METHFKKQIENQRGQSLVEYLILTCLVAIAAVSVVSLVGRNIQEQYANISHALTKGDGKSVSLSEPVPKTLAPKGLHNFMENTEVPSNGR